MEGEHDRRFCGIANGVALKRFLAEVGRERDLHPLGVKGLGFGVKGVGAAGAAAAGEHGHKKQRAEDGRKRAFHTGISYSLLKFKI